MGKIKDWWQSRKVTKQQNFTAADFYLMLSYYDIKSTNIAVIGNEKKFMWLMEHLVKKAKEDSSQYTLVIPKSKTQYRLFKGDLETTYVLINDIHTDLELNNLKYRKYM